MDIFPDCRQSVNDLRFDEFQDLSPFFIANRTLVFICKLRSSFFRRQFIITGIRKISDRILHRVMQRQPQRDKKISSGPSIDIHGQHPQGMSDIRGATLSYLSGMMILSYLVKNFKNFSIQTRHQAACSCKIIGAEEKIPGQSPEFFLHKTLHGPLCQL